jgi:hypothetical protein
MISRTCNLRTTSGKPQSTQGCGTCGRSEISARLRSSNGDWLIQPLGGRGRFLPNLFQLVKVGYEWLPLEGVPGTHDNVFGVQLVTSIHSLSKALK